MTDWTPEQKASRASHDQRHAAGQYLGRGRVVRGASDKQLKLLASLIANRALPQDADPVVAKRIADVQAGWTPNLRLASDMIDFLMLQPKKEGAVTSVVNPASDKQAAFIRNLAKEKDWQAGSVPAHQDTVSTVLAGGAVSKRDASLAIDYLFGCPARPVVAAAPAEGDLTPGVYKVDDEVFIVKPNQAKTRLYAKRLVELGAAQGDRLAEDGEHVRVEFEYAPGAIHRITPAHRMSVEEGKALTIRYGKCICCGRKLKVATSVERGIGPVCIKYFA